MVVWIGFRSGSWVDCAMDAWHPMLPLELCTRYTQQPSLAPHHSSPCPTTPHKIAHTWHNLPQPRHMQHPTMPCAWCGLGPKCIHDTLILYAGC